MIGCIQEVRYQPKQELTCKPIQKKHEPYDWALPGTLENIKKIDEFLKKQEKVGYLFGGCLEKRLPRKDIDVFSEYWFTDSQENPGYKTLGVDWWFLEEYNYPPTGKNLNGIETRLPFLMSEYAKKDEGGLYLPEGYISKHPRKKLTRLLYSQEIINELKGGEIK